jgi:DNA-binding LacI/PurR family transcriptional regulator
MGQVVAEHLIERGHRRIGFLNGHWLPGDNLLLSGLQRSMAAHELPADHLAMHLVPSEPGMIRAGFDTLVGSRGITAIVCRSDAMVLECMAIAKSRGMKIPEDIAFVCVGDNSPEIQRESVTCMSRDGQELGRLAGEMLLKLVRGQVIQRMHVEVPCELIKRSST